MKSNEIVLDEKRCNGCGVCVRTCPQFVYESAGNGAPVAVAHGSRCIGCMACEEDCARGALKVHRLPDGMSLGDVPEPCKGLDADAVHDVLIIGAGPAGLGAAIRARTLGLSVAVIERLPSPCRAHHPDGGQFSTSPDVYKVDKRPGGLFIGGLDLIVPQRFVLEWLRDFIFMGPDGFATKSAKGEAFIPIVAKDGLVETLADRSRELGAVIAYNTRAGRIEKRGADGLVGVECDDGMRLRAKVVISAEGITGRLSAAVGIPVNEMGVGWAYAVETVQPPVAEALDEMVFLLGRVAGAPDMPFFSFWSSGSHHVKLVTGPLQTEKSRQLQAPLTDCLDGYATKDERVAKRVGRFTSPFDNYDGCRVYGRRLPCTGVGDGVLAVGDAVATAGMCGTPTAIKTGDVAAQVAASAIGRGDTSAAGLADFDKLVMRNSMMTEMKMMHNILIEATLNLSQADLRDFYKLLRHLELTRLMSGVYVMPLVKFLIKALPGLIRRPDLRAYMKS